LVELSKLNDVMKSIRSKGYVPTDRASELVKLMGKNLATDAFMNGAITMKMNDEDKTFDIIIGKEIIDASQKKLEEELENRGYCLTLKGEKFVRSAYGDGRFCDKALTGLLSGGKGND